MPIETSLSPLSITTPSLPANVTTLSVDSDVLPLVINADTSTLAIDVVVGSTTTTLTAFTVVNGQNQFTGSVDITAAATAPLALQISGRNYVTTAPSTILLTPIVQLDVIYAPSNLATQITPPTGVTISKGQSTCRVEWALPTFEGFQGVRVRWSTDPSGVTVPYQQYGGIQNDVTRSANVTLTGPSSTIASTPKTTINGQTTNTVVTTSTEVTATINYDSIDIPAGAVSADVFYVILTTLVQDPVTNQQYESQAAGPYTCGFVNLQVVKPTDFLELQKASDIASRMMAEINRRRPDLDLTARAEARDVSINPIALEIANMSVRAMFARCCQSISALSQIDDADGDGISDPVASSPIKQQIAQAYGLDNSSVQSFIDRRFEILGEGAGLQRGGSTYATDRLTFYTYNKPTASILIPVGTVCSTVPNTLNPTAVTFVTTASAVIDVRNLAAFFDVENGWWGVTVPAMAQVAGSAGNVGAESITQVVSGGPSGLAVINLDKAAYGTDEQSNADYAAMIQNRLVTGKDTGTRGGYWNTAMQVPGIVDALVVAANDVDMLRDWSSILQKHTYGCVDIYVQGSTTSQQTESVPFSLAPPSTYGSYGSYLPCTLASIANLSFRITGFAALASPIYAAVEMVAVSAGRTAWLGTANAQFDNVNGIIYLNPNDNPYTINADGSTTIWQINGANATNLQFLQAMGASPVSYSLMPQLQSGISHVPAQQPVTAVDSVTGAITGSIASDDIELIHTTDFLLSGGSNKAQDTITVSGVLTQPVEKTLTLASATTLIDSDIAVALDANGNPQNILSVRPTDLSTVYTFGIDYTIVASGRYRTYSLQVLNDSTGNPRIPIGSTAQVVVAYNQYLLRERVTEQTDSLTLSGSTPAALSLQGFIHNTWLPAAHDQTGLLLDSSLIAAGVQAQSRYIKVTSNGAVMTEGHDFVLTVDATGAATVTRVTGGGIPDGGTVSVSYYASEVFTIASEYPAYVAQLVTTLQTTAHAAADILVKAMIGSPVNLVLNVTLDDATTPSAVDGTIRTAAGLVVQNSSTKLAQSKIVQQVQAIPGLVSVGLPLVHCAKADGAYDIGVLIPTSTPWLALSSDPLFSGLTLPANAWISQNILLPDPTIPSGGSPNSYVGLLYEGQMYRRALSVTDFLNSQVPSFYIVGTNDMLNATTALPSTYSGKILLATPGDTTNPALRPYRVTFQVYGAASADDLTTASCEYFTIGSITINYVSGAA